MNFADHPTVVAHRSHAGTPPPAAALDRDDLVDLALAAGADDAGVVDVADPAFDPDRAEIEEFFPAAKSALAFVVKMNRMISVKTMLSRARSKLLRALKQIDQNERN